MLHAGQLNAKIMANLAANGAAKPVPTPHTGAGVVPPTERVGVPTSTLGGVGVGSVKEGVGVRVGSKKLPWDPTALEGMEGEGEGGSEEGVAGGVVSKGKTEL